MKTKLELTYTYCKDSLVLKAGDIKMVCYIESNSPIFINGNEDLDSGIIRYAPRNILLVAIEKYLKQHGIEDIDMSVVNRFIERVNTPLHNGGELIQYIPLDKLTIGKQTTQEDLVKALKKDGLVFLLLQEDGRTVLQVFNESYMSSPICREVVQPSCKNINDILAELGIQCSLSHYEYRCFLLYTTDKESEGYSHKDIDNILDLIISTAPAKIRGKLKSSTNALFFYAAALINDRN